MTIRTSREPSAWNKKSRKWFVAVLLLAALVLASTMASGRASASTTFVVNSTADTPDASTTASACDTDTSTTGKQCTLRAAIEQANATAGADTINFAIPGTGVKTINVGATGFGDLPDITERVTIDGYTQPGAHPNTKALGDDAALKVVLNGTDAGSADGLAIDSASGSIIKGLVINRFSDVGIEVFPNSFSTPTVGTHIEGNFIGTDASGTIDKGNGSDGIALFAPDISQTVIGGTTPAARNLISGNDENGVAMGDIFLDDGQSESIRIQGNYVGTDRSGTKDLGNRFDGLFVEHTTGATIGGKTAASRNVVSGNDGGVDLFSDSGLRLLGNRIGTTANGTGALGNDRYGVLVDGPDTDANNVLGDGTAAGANTVAFNGGDGIDIKASIGNEVSRNSIFSNAGLGIDLRGPGEGFTASIPTPNDQGDTDSGPNNLQNKPVLTSAKSGSLKTTIKGNLDSNPNRTYTVEFYANPQNTNEGKKFIGETTFTTSVDGLHAFTFSPATKVPVGQTVTATATNTTSTSPHDTSEFSAPRTVTSA